MQFGTAGAIDTAAEEKGANDDSAGGVSAGGVVSAMDGEPAVDELTEMDQAAMDGEAELSEMTGGKAVDMAVKKLKSANGVSAGKNATGVGAKGGGSDAPRRAVPLGRLLGHLGHLGRGGRLGRLGRPLGRPGAPAQDEKLQAETSKKPTAVDTAPRHRVRKTLSAA